MLEHFKYLGSLVMSKSYLYNSIEREDLERPTSKPGYEDEVVQLLCPLISVVHCWALESEQKRFSHTGFFWYEMLKKEFENCVVISHHKQICAIYD